MKKQILYCLCGLFGMISLADAQGLYQQGFVEINTRSGGSVHMLATFNNRYNTIDYGSPTQLIALPSPTKSEVVFYGMDSNFTTFMCLVSPSSEYYDFAQQAALNLRSGTMLSISKPSGSNECSYVGVANASSFLD